jgi:hypothetical protein
MLFLDMVCLTLASSIFFAVSLGFLPFVVPIAWLRRRELNVSGELELNVAGERRDQDKESR